MSEGLAGLRLESSGARLAGAGAVFIVSLATYSLTLAPAVTLVDSGELIVAARTLGVAHPPGFPLYVLLAHLATLIPIGSVAVRVNFASAIFAALASATLALVAAEALLTSRQVQMKTGQRKPVRGNRATKAAPAKRPKAAEQVLDSNESRIALAGCLASGLLFAFSRTLWAYATIAEVYALNTFLIIGILLLMFHWRRLIVSDPTPRAAGVISRHDRWLDAGALLFGLGLGVHHVSVGLMLPALAWLVLATEGLSFFASKRLLRAAASAFAGLAIYIYLPLAASRSPHMNWGDPQTLQRFWWHITGRQYQVFFTFSSDRMGHQLREFLQLVGHQFGAWFIAVGLLFAVLGALALVKRDKTTFWFLGLVIACNVIYSTSYEIAEDKDAYYLPTFAAIAIASAFFVEWLVIRDLRLSRLPSAATRATVSLVLLLAPILGFVGNLPFSNRSRYFIAQDYVENILSVIEPGGMLLTRDWQVYSPMMYVNEIERRRTDVVAIDINQLRRSWYFDYLRQAYPPTIDEARDLVDSFLEDLRQWEQDPDLYQRDASLNQRINTRFYDMIRAFVTDHLRRGQVYITQDIALNREASDADLTKWLSDSYQFVPQGLVFQVTEKGATVQLTKARLATRGLADGSVRFEADDVVKVKVIPVYTSMLSNRGRYLAAQGRHEDAIEAFRQALEIEPSFGPANKALNDSQSALRKSGTGTDP
jgi:tetratricopeptide (TPR) repeat protein